MFRDHVWVPLVLVALGFWGSRSTDTIWTVAVVGAVVALCAVGLRLLRRAAWSYGDEISGPARAAVLVTAVLVELGGLLTVRLVVVPDPVAPFAAGLHSDALNRGFFALVLPLLGVGAALALVAVLMRGDGTWLGRTSFGRWMHAQGSGRIEAAVAPSDSVVERSWRVGAMLVLLLSALFLLPRWGSPTGSAWLTIAGVATPEYGKLVLLVALAVVVARDSYAFETFKAGRLYTNMTATGGHRSFRRTMKAAFLATRYAVYPLALFTLVVLAGGVRRDFGTLVSTLAATIGITWAATGHNVRRSLVRKNPLRYLVRLFSAYRLFLGVGAVLLVLTGVSALLFTDYVSERGRVWADPWAYRWEAGCVAAEPGVTAPSVPSGTVVCQRSLAADAESERSQLARALSVVADGGLWGRGLRDTTSQAVPAGPTDFVVAVMWNKLGGIVVLATAVLTVLLGAALIRTVRPPGTDPAGSPSVAALLGSGLAATIVGQYLFVFAATTNMIPHSGIPAPFLSRGGQSTVALVLGVILVLSLGPAAAGTASPVRATALGPLATRRFPSWPGILVPAVAFAAIATTITLVPYPAPMLRSHDQKRPSCSARAEGRDGLLTKPPDPAVCSTDRVAYARTQVEIRFGPQAGLVLRRPEGVWEVTDSGALGGLTVEDLAGLVRVGEGHIGVLERSYPDVVDGTAGTDLRRRLSAPSSPGLADGGLELTLNPGWQHLMAQAMRGPDDNRAGPLAGGLVVIDATTGKVLVMASAPGERVPTPTPDAEVSGEAERKFNEEHPYYGRLRPDGSLNDAARDESCERQASNADLQRGCWAWSYTEPGAADSIEAAERDLRRYVDNDLTVELPSPQINRALGKWYGFGSTFKVIIAAAYLGLPGARASDLIDAPETVWLSPETIIHNAGGGYCRGTVDEQITLTRALAVSCNTAFVALAQQLGWPRIAEQAGKFGLVVGTCRKTDPWLVGHFVGAVDSCVPADTDDIAIGNNALGGQDVQGTPLAMATVMAAIANDGRAVQPRLVTAFTPPDTGETVRAPDGETRVAVTPQVDAELWKALSQTAIDGTAAGLRDVCAKLWVKTGTHELVPAGTPLRPGQFVREDAWMAGFLETPNGRVAFAVVIETRDPAAGAQRVRFLVKTLCQMVGGG